MHNGSGCECSSKTFSFTDNRLEFTCEGVSEGWDVCPTEGTEVST